MLLTAMAALACGGDDGDTPSATAPAATEVARATSAPASPAATSPASPTSAAPRPTTQAPARQTPAAPAADPTPVATVMPTPRPTPTPGPTLRPLLDQTSARTDREVLIALYPMLGRWDQSSLDGWRSDAPLGEWEGVTTDSNGRVTEIDIVAWDYEELPWELGNLAYLEVLRIEKAGQGQATYYVIGIPPDLGNLTNLRVLRLTSLNSPGRGKREALKLPPELGNLTNLEELVLSNISIIEKIPAELGNLANLQSLSLSGVSGEIPAELGNLANLQSLSLSGDFSGEIPAELGNLANLEVLRLSGDFSGEIPAELGNLANLKELGLPWGLSGCVPLELRGQVFFSFNEYPFCIDPRVVAEQMSVLTALYDATGGDNWYDNTNWLSDADLGEWYGVTTDDEGYITGLKLYENDLSGAIPAELGQLARLQSLYLYGNSLTGCIPASLEYQLTDTELGGLSYCGR